ncbi:MAG: metalloregulator ArsR/SmtB family transcription factor [Gemmatimonadota bacterium]
MRQPPVVTRLNALADATRGRLLLVLERHELTVSELCAALQLPQSTVSRHLRILADGGWVASRAEGASRLYRLALNELEAPARRLWQVVRESLATLPASLRDGERLRTVLAERRTRSEEFFASAAAQWDKLRAELFGGRTELLPLLGLLESDWTVGDLGCGTGHLSLAVAPMVARVIAVDSSAAMIKTGRARLAGHDSVEVRKGELEALPIEDAALDLAFLVLVLPYVAEPGRVVAEAARALKPGGRLLIVDLMPHDRDEYRQTMGHQWQGFTEPQLLGWLDEAGMVNGRYRAAAPDPAARGPMLFTASAAKR